MAMIRLRPETHQRYREYCKVNNLDQTKKLELIMKEFLDSQSTRKVKA